MHTEDVILKSIITDMSEGVMTIGFNGVISHVNPAAEVILGMTAEALVGKSFARCFFEHSENDAFNQCILDAVYDASCAHRNIDRVSSSGWSSRPKCRMHCSSFWSTMPIFIRRWICCSSSASSRASVWESLKMLFGGIIDPYGGKSVPI